MTAGMLHKTGVTVTVTSTVGIGEYDGLVLAGLNATQSGPGINHIPSTPPWGSIYLYEG